MAIWLCHFPAWNLLLLLIALEGKFKTIMIIKLKFLTMYLVSASLVLPFLSLSLISPDFPQFSKFLSISQCHSGVNLISAPIGNDFLTPISLNFSICSYSILYSLFWNSQRAANVLLKVFLPCQPSVRTEKVFVSPRHPAQCLVYKTC